MVLSDEAAPFMAGTDMTCVMMVRGNPDTTCTFLKRDSRVIHPKMPVHGEREEHKSWPTPKNSSLPLLWESIRRVDLDLGKKEEKVNISESLFQQFIHQLHSGLKESKKGDQIESKQLATELFTPLHYISTARSQCPKGDSKGRANPDSFITDQGSRQT